MRKVISISLASTSTSELPTRRNRRRRAIKGADNALLSASPNPHVRPRLGLCTTSSLYMRCCSDSASVSASGEAFDDAGSPDAAVSDMRPSRSLTVSGAWDGQPRRRRKGTRSECIDGECMYYALLCPNDFSSICSGTTAGTKHHYPNRLFSEWHSEFEGRCGLTELRKFRRPMFFLARVWKLR